MTKEEAKHWFVTVLINIAIGVILLVIAFRYTDKKVTASEKNIEPKLDLIIEQQDTIINKLGE